MEVLLPPSLDPNTTPYHVAFSRKEQMPSVAEERGNRGISSIHCPGKPGWLTKLFLHEVAHLPSWALSPAGLSIRRLLLPQTPEAGAACRHRAALGWGRHTNGEGQGEGSFEIIYKHIRKFHYFCVADSSTQEYKSSRIAPAPAPGRCLGLTPRFRAPTAQMH